ncbi:hypothetical protein SERLADRAFT_437842 [Serpula lacrymans var. lacrymans S7.9]|uniref:Xylanolytic transcriptional activator regulatory domain-containing protein n=1 Tax=Serpula lacrymans var. lacrymans (strain S7.9) TaxID=578457 RepID=F8NVR9_SERL9|nr:uncharacterized protein SERLADRAFT_437842 [Serpula lacrymans var. lacrymans S7.9]EGO24230.1 hypothetical protein SERLADRAFT_437842 [Serpula lacrymans var. lacrymans S7.9]
MPGDRCSNCIAYNFECTYIQAAKKRGPPKGYVESLENRLEKMEKLLQKVQTTTAVCPDADFTQELGGGHIDREKWAKAGQGASTMTASHIMGAPSTSTVTNAATPAEDLDPSDDEELIQLRLTESIRKMAINPLHYRFFGKSSGFMLIKKAIDLKKEYTGDEDSKEKFWVRKRPEFNSSFPWELAGKDIVDPNYVFPDDDLGLALVDLYFTHINLLYPFLHRPSFERSVAEGLHLRDSSFGAVYLVVCAVGSRWSDDPRVFLEGTTSEHSCGWKYFEQVQMVRKTLLGPPCLFDLQVYCLSVIFLQGSSAPQACWTIVGIGVRLAQDVGAHRRSVYNPKPTMEDELWKRAFWVLVSLDRTISSTLGRPCAIQDEDIDLELPIECDDEYWETSDPEKAFKQPPDKPSVVSCFVNLLKLHQILAFALRTIYSINKSKVLLGFVGQQWEQHIVAELDSALNKWIDAVPDHLRWDPNREDDRFFMQSACLYSMYYHLQILIHRPFIPSPRKPSPLSFPSLAICTNAARSCSHVIDILRKRSGVAIPYVQISAFTAGIVLLLNIWGGKRSGLATYPKKEMSDVHKCMQVLRVCERRWHSAGRLWDVLYELASVGDLPLPQPSPTGGNKRERDSDSPISAAPSSSSSAAVVPEVPRNIAGSRRVSHDIQPPQPQQQQQQQHQQQLQQPPTPNPAALFNLPVYSDDLGRLPLHGQVDFASPSGAASLDASAGMWFPMGAASAPTHPSVSPDVLTNAGLGPYRDVSAPTYTMDELFYDQMANQFASPFSSAATDQFGGPGPSMQALMGGTNPAAQQHVGMLGHAGVHATNSVMDDDTMAMWSNAPTGFELDDWGTYITSVSGLVHHDGAGRQDVSEHQH